MSRPRVPLRIALFLLALPALTSFMAPVHAATDSVHQTLVGQGWQAVAPGLYERAGCSGNNELLAFGRLGLELEIGRLQTIADQLAKRFEETHHTDLEQALTHLEGVIDGLERQLDAFPRDLGAQGPPSNLAELGDLSVSCTTSINRAATAGPGSNGPTASGSGSFSDSCSHSGEVYAFAHAEGFLGSVFDTHTQVDGPKTGVGSASASASTSNFVSADNNCLSNGLGRSRVTDSNGATATFLVEQNSTACRTLTVSIASGPSSLFVPYGQCINATWTASANLPGTSFTWRWNGSVVGSGSSYTRQICSTNPSSTFSQNNTLSLAGTNSGQSASASRVVSVTFEGFSDPCECPPLPCEPCLPCFKERRDGNTRLPQEQCPLTDGGK